jgi:hypothetical protein
MLFAAMFAAIRNRLRQGTLCPIITASNVVRPKHSRSQPHPKGDTVRQPELTSLLGLRDSDGDRLVLVRLDRPDGTRGYLLRIGSGSVFLTVGDLKRLSTVIRLELFHASQFRFVAPAIWLLILCAMVWLFTSAVGPLFSYPWSN